MIDSRSRTGGDSWLACLERLADTRCIWEPSDRGRDFFGEDWILPQAFWESLQTERIDDLAELLPRLQERPFEDPYFGSEAIGQQGSQIAQGAILVVLAACRYAQRHEPTARILAACRRDG